MPPKKKKIFVVDTNVLLHDYKSIYNFKHHDIVIPIQVLEELDRFKKGNDQINFNAREFTRELDKLSGDDLLVNGIPLGQGLGNLSIETGEHYSETMDKAFSEKINDHKILAIAEYIHHKHPKQKVIFVTKDINLRMKAKAIGVVAEDYKGDNATNIEEDIRKSIQLCDVDDSTVLKRIYDDPDGVPWEDFKLSEQPIPHQYFIFKNGKSSALAHFDPVEKRIERVEKRKAYGIEPRNAEQTFSLHALMNPEVQLITLTGKAGTGKTLLALASALHQRKKYTQIMLARPIVPLSNRDLGYLPGDIKDKIGPYMQPLFDNLGVIKNQYKSESKEYANLEDMQKDEKLIITPLAYIRGRSLSNVFIIVDEAQNLTPHEVKTIITRAGEGTKIVFTGDIEQIDSPYLDLKSNGLSYLTDKMLGQDIFAHINLVKGERSYLADLASKLL